MLKSCGIGPEQPRAGSATDEANPAVALTVVALTHTPTRPDPKPFATNSELTVETVGCAVKEF